MLRAREVSRGVRSSSSSDQQFLNMPDTDRRGAPESPEMSTRDRERQPSSMWEASETPERPAPDRSSDSSEPQCMNMPGADDKCARSAPDRSTDRSDSHRSNM